MKLALGLGLRLRLGLGEEVDELETTISDDVFGASKRGEPRAVLHPPLRIHVAEKVVGHLNWQAPPPSPPFQLPADSGLVHWRSVAARLPGISGGMSQNQLSGESTQKVRGDVDVLHFSFGGMPNFLAAIGHQTLLIAHS